LYNKTQKIDIVNLIKQRRSREILKKSIRTNDYIFNSLLRTENEEDMEEKIIRLKNRISTLKEDIKELDLQNKQLNNSLKKSRDINKRLLLILNDHGILAECISSSPIFKKVSYSFYLIGIIHQRN